MGRVPGHYKKYITFAICTEGAILKQSLIRKAKLFTLELTNLCNLNCAFCANQFMTRKKGMMDIGLAKRLIKEAKDTKFCYRIVTNVMGEPLLHPNLFEILQYARSLRQKMCVITNGELLDERMARELLECQPEEICISSHSHNDTSYQYRHAAHTNYEQYKNRILNFIELKFKLRIDTQINVLLLSTKELPSDKFSILDKDADIILLRDEWISFAKHLKKQYKISWIIPNSLFPGKNMLLPGFSIFLLSRYHTWSGNILPTATKMIPDEKAFCLCPFEQFNVLWNGDLTLCCIDYNGDLVYDNIKNKNIAEAFNSQRITGIRKSFIEGCNVPAKCTVCCGRLVNLDGSVFKCQNSFMRLSVLDNLKRIYFLTQRLLWEGSLLKYISQKYYGILSTNQQLQRTYWRNFTKYLTRQDSWLP